MVGQRAGVERRSEAFDLEEISQKTGGRDAYLTWGLPTCVWGFLGKELGMFLNLGADVP
jgi:hypothetical protein